MVGWASRFPRVTPGADVTRKRPEHHPCPQKWGKATKRSLSDRATLTFHWVSQPSNKAVGLSIWRVTHPLHINRLFFSSVQGMMAQSLPHGVKARTGGRSRPDKDRAHRPQLLSDGSVAMERDVHLGLVNANGSLSDCGACAALPHVARGGSASSRVALWSGRGLLP